MLYLAVMIFFGFAVGATVGPGPRAFAHVSNDSFFQARSMRDRRRGDCVQSHFTCEHLNNPLKKKMGCPGRRRKHGPATLASTSRRARALARHFCDLVFWTLPRVSGLKPAGTSGSIDGLL
jgi:hypothetical protein